MSEKDWIRRYFAPFATTEHAAGLRDDVAELATSGQRIITVDALVVGVHFLPDDPIDSIARKLVRVNVSDVLASGALPEQALLTLGWPDSRSEADLAEFAAAFGQELQDWSVALIGGDTVHAGAGRGLFLSLTLTGRCLSARGPIRRSGARETDRVWVSGVIGEGWCGLNAVKEGNTKSEAAHHYREPRIPDEAIAGLISQVATASIDVSDGLLGDMKALADASGVGANISIESIPLAADTDDLKQQLSLMTGGDDYQALFCAPADQDGFVDEYARQNGLKLSKIGDIQAGSGLHVYKNGRVVNLPETLGFEHG